MTTKECIIAGNDHYNTLNVVRALGKAKLKVHLVLVADEDKSFVAKSRYVSCCHFAKDESDAITWLKKSFEKKEKTPLIPTYDEMARRIDREYDSLSNHFLIPSVAHKAGKVEWLMDKEVQLRLAKGAGFKVPESFRLADAKSLNTDSLKFPCILKPSVSAHGSKKNFKIFQNANELKQWIDKNKPQLNNYLIQTFIPNQRLKEVVGVRLDDGSTYIACAINKIKFGYKTETMGLNVVSRLEKDPILENLCKKFIETADFYGLFAIEVIEDTDHNNNPIYHFIETNLRTDACQFIYNSADINYPLYWATQQFPSDTDLIPKHIGINEIHYIKSFLSPKKLFSNLADFLKADTFAYFSLDDPKPFFAKLLRH